MAILLKELTIRYSPKMYSIAQIIRDYYAMFSVWKNQGSGGANVSPTNQRKTELVDDVFEQVSAALYKGIEGLFKAQWSGFEKTNPKEIEHFHHAFKVKDWLDFHAAVDAILNVNMPGYASDVRRSALNPSKERYVSPEIKQFTGYKNPPPTPPPVSKWKAFDKPLKASPIELPQDLPMAGGQMNLPITRQKKIPTPDFTGVPPIGNILPKEPKQLTGNWDKLLADFGYQWNDAEKCYVHPTRNGKIQTFTDNTVKVSVPSGTSKTFPNLGTLFRALAHNQEKRHAEKPEAEPAAALTEADFKPLYEFLYT